MALDRSNVLLQGVVGSTAYGLNHEGSDVDRLGIYAAPIEYVLGLNGSTDLIHGAQNVDDSLVKHEPDVTLHEVGKYVRLALSANPTVLELLYLPEYEISKGAGLILVENRKAFLCAKQVKARYGGYAKAQAERLLRREAEGKEGFSSNTKARTEKHGRHCRRLIMQGAQLLMTGELQVKLDDVQREVIFQAGECAARDPQAFHESVMREIKMLDAIDSDLPDQPDRELVDDLLVGIRLHEGKHFIQGACA